MSIRVNSILEVSSIDYKQLAIRLRGEQDFNPINPNDDGFFYHKSTLVKFLDGTLEFDKLPTNTELDEVKKIVDLMDDNNTLFLYVK
jgi:hypothetical protein